MARPFRFGIQLQELPREGPVPVRRRPSLAVVNLFALRQGPAAGAVQPDAGRRALGAA